MRGGMYLPNLAALSPTTRPISQPPQEQPPLGELDFSSLISSPSKKRLIASVDLGDSTWQGEFVVGGDALVLPQREDSSKECVEAVLLRRRKGRKLHLNSLFHEIKDTEQCLMSSGFRKGDAVLRVVSYVANSIGTTVTLDDAAEFRVDEERLSYMSEFLRLKRGFGLYEARGFVPKEIDEACGKDLDQILLVCQLELKWTQMIATTPLGSLKAAIADFVKSVQDKPRNECAAVSAMKRMYTENTKYLCQSAVDLTLLFLKGATQADSFDVEVYFKRLTRLPGVLEAAFSQTRSVPEGLVPETATLRNLCLETPFGDSLVAVSNYIWRKTWDDIPMEWRDLVKRFERGRAIRVVACEGSPVASLEEVHPVCFEVNACQQSFSGTN